MRRAPSRPGFERYEARFAGHAFGPHRHDSYAIGLTLQGVQAFGYRGGAAVSLAGEAMILHPDERHDGRAGSDAGFRYRILYLEPRLLRAALDDPRQPLPFVPSGVSDDPRLRTVLLDALGDLESPLDELRAEQLVVDLADALSALDPSSRGSGRLRLDAPALEQARDLLASDLERPIGAAEMEAATGLDRYRLARQFRAAYGTSPHRYRVMRRLDRARLALEQGRPPSEVALAAGFADQSHLTRQFKTAYGLTPGAWAAISRAAG